MNKKYLYFNDGQEISQELYENLKEYKLFSNSHGKFYVDFVGFFEYTSNNINYRIFSYPKEYEVNIKKGKMYDEDCTCDKEKKLVLNTLNRNILKSEKFENNLFYRIDAASQILKYYKEHGLYIEISKINMTKQAGKIDFRKTIKKVRPVFINDEMLYDRYIVKKNHVDFNIITECMVFILKEVFFEYPFYFKKIHVDFECNNQLFKNKKIIVKELKKILSKIFNDATIKLVNNIIYYFEESSKNNSSNSYFCTTKYELIYESLISKVLGNDYKETVIYINSGDVNKQVGDTKKIRLDHYNEKKKIIVDSKYFTFKENESNVDYKQLFYQYVVVNRNLKQGATYNDKIDEAKKTKNILLKPKGIGSSEEKNLIVNRIQDGISLSEYFISMNELVEYNTHKYKYYVTINLIKNLLVEEYNITKEN